MILKEGNWDLVTHDLRIDNSGSRSKVTLSVDNSEGLLSPFQPVRVRLKGNEGTLNVGMATMPGTSLEESNKLGYLLEEVLLEHPAVISTARRVGRAEMVEHTMGSHGHEIEIRLENDSYEINDLIEELREKAEALPGMNVSCDQPITHRIDHMLTGVRTNLAVKVFGPDRQRLQWLRLYSEG